MATSAAITILGSTGTIGVNTLDVISRHPDRYKVFALTANTNVDKLFEQCCEYRPKYVVMVNDASAEQLLKRLHDAEVVDTEVLTGVSGLEQVASDTEVDYVMAAIVGAAGLLPTLAAAKSGKRVLLANKESLVMSGKLLMDAVSDNNATLLPIDSEHNAIWQCMPQTESTRKSALATQGVTKILLTASGGPFREIPVERLSQVTPEQACAHPNWKMGRKISVDSATMMNKGLEVIEACWLFHTNAENIQVIMHPQSIVHSMVAYSDGSVLAQMGNPDMRTPIAHALAWPDRVDAGVEPLDFFVVAHLSFEKPDFDRFPCLRLSYDAAQRGGTAAAVLNAANEVAVAKFLAGDIQFTDIAGVVSSVLENATIHEADSLEVVIQDDVWAREYAMKCIRDVHSK